MTFSSFYWLQSIQIHLFFYNWFHQNVTFSLFCSLNDKSFLDIRLLYDLEEQMVLETIMRAGLEDLPLFVNYLQKDRVLREILVGSSI